jgi:hypothetical protein
MKKAAGTAEQTIPTANASPQIGRKWGKRSLPLNKYKAIWGKPSLPLSKKGNQRRRL